MRKFWRLTGFACLFANLFMVVFWLLYWLVLPEKFNGFFFACLLLNGATVAMILGVMGMPPMPKPIARPPPDGN